MFTKYWINQLVTDDSVKVNVPVHVLFYEQCHKNRYYGTERLVGYFVSTIYIKHFLKQIVQLNITMIQSYETDVKGIQRVVNILSV